MVKITSLVKVIAGPRIYMQGTVTGIENGIATINDCHVPAEWPKAWRERKVRVEDLELLLPS